MSRRELDGGDATLAHRDAQIAALTAELVETNRGVVALYAELEDRAMQLTQTTQLKSRFLSYMSHEFRTPLGAMQSITRLLLDGADGPLNQEQTLQVQLLRNSTLELSDMIDDLLDLAKVEAGRISISPDWFELVNLFSALRGMFKPLIDSRPVSLTFEEPRDIPKIYTDDKKLGQILRNFISNAMKFTPEGEIRVSAELVGGEQVCFSVTDTGIGIDPAQQAALFEDFSQIDNPLQKRLRGTGLGLSLSRKLADLLGGAVGVDSALGKGSRFWVRVPLQYRNAPTS